ncbi:hypothetical protein C3L33_16006, partial [Rhododendron williamsianum]
MTKGLYCLQTEYGDKYDCVDFYDQPAFDHPMLKNHSFYFEFAVVRTRAGAGKFNGAGATLSLHRPRVPRGQYSAGRFKIQNAVEAIQVGWRVDPDLYGGDTRTRAFIRVDAGRSHCFNTRCPGFVLVRSDVPLDFVYEQTSNDLANPATYVEWGGMVYSPPGTPTPEMGSGHFLKLDTKYDAYFRNIQVFNDLGRNVDEFNTDTFNDIGVYDVVDKKNAQNFGHLVLYGGPSL